MKGWWILGHLVLLSFWDLKDGRLPVGVLLELGISGALRMFLGGHEPFLLPGIFLLLLGAATREKIGYGDGWLMLTLGMWMSAEELFRMLFLGTLLSVLLGAAAGKRELPFVPFLTAGALLGGCI